MSDEKQSDALNALQDAIEQVLAQVLKTSPNRDTINKNLASGKFKREIFIQCHPLQISYSVLDIATQGRWRVFALVPGQEPIAWD